MKTIKLLKILSISLVITILLISCIYTKNVGVGTIYIASRGSRPPAQSIVWSPTDENKVMIRAYETPLQPAEVYILDIQTGQKEFIVGPLVSATFIDVKWTPDGKKALIFAEDHTKGFEPSGWWAVDIVNKKSEYLLDPVDDASWSPDGKKIAVLRRNQGGNTISIDLQLIDTNTKDIETIATYKDADFSAGLSWSPDGRNIVFSLGQYGSGSSNLFTLSIETRQVIKITKNDRSEYPSWSPKGNIIVLERNSSNKVGDYLYLISSDGKCEVEIPNLEHVWSPTWSPDGKKLGYIGTDGIYYLEIEKVLGRDIYQNLCK